MLRLEMQRRSSRVETVESSDESEAEGEGEGREGDHPYDIFYKFEQMQRSSFFKQAKKTYPMFPYTEEKIKVFLATFLINTSWLTFSLFKIIHLLLQAKESNFNNFYHGVIFIELCKIFVYLFTVVGIIKSPSRRGG